VKKQARLTVDMSPEQHMYIKMACAKLGITMREFLLESAFKRIEKIEDRWLVARARETLREIDSGIEKTIPWNKAKKALGWHEL